MMPETYINFQRNNISKNLMQNIPSPLSLGIFLGDGLAIILSQLLAEKTNLLFNQNFDPNQSPNLLTTSSFEELFIILGVILIGVLSHKGFYQRRIPWWSQVQYISKLAVFSLLGHIFINTALQLNQPLLLITSGWIYTLLSMFCLRVCFFKLAKYLPNWKVPTVIISEGATSEDLLYAFHSDLSTGYVVDTIFIRSSKSNSDLDITNLSKQSIKVKMNSLQKDYCDYITIHPDHFFVVSIDTFRDTCKDQIIKTLNQSNVSYAIVPTLSHANLYQMKPEYFFGHDVVMLHIGNRSLPPLDNLMAKTLKRSIDIFISGIGLILIAPFVAIFAALLKIEGQTGSIFYGGRRIGKNGAFFHCWKLRSMEPNSDHLLTTYLDKNPDIKADWEKYRKLPKDPRVTTRTARFLRKSGLDELPQIWNIFIGDMSLVGPRPILEDEMSYFEEETLKEYLSIRPGLTGLWQVSGRNKTSFKRRIYWDSWYVRNWSLWGDLVILVQTPFVLLTRKGAL
ncbi:MAG: sugar transferase [Alphaproteobacteria bacterium]|nr:sugar transferase [Alphaproteobacteria bacterium]